MRLRAAPQGRFMGIHSKLLGFLAGTWLAASACAGQWFTVASPASNAAAPLVEIDVDTVRIHAGGGEGVIRVSFDEPQTHGSGFSYRSLVAIAYFDCTKRGISLGSAAYYQLPAGQGVRLGVDSAGRQAGMPPSLLESIPAAARQALVKASCATAPVN